MPLGLDTPSTIGVAVMVLGPEFLRLKSAGYTADAAAASAWYVGMATMLYMGSFKLILSAFGDLATKLLPIVGLLGSLAGVAVGLIGVTALLDIFRFPIVGLVALGFLLYSVIAGISLPWRIPGVLASVAFATALYFCLTYFRFDGATRSLLVAAPQIQLCLPTPTVGFIQGMRGAIRYLPLSAPFALLTVIGGINVTASAKAAGDEYSTRSILLVEAIATIVAGLFGGVAQTTPYIGHPAYKQMGARAGYTLFAGIVLWLMGTFGLTAYVIQLVPRAILAPILLLVAMDIIAQAFRVVDKNVTPAIALALFPAVFKLLSITLRNPRLVPVESYRNAMASAGTSLSELQIIVSLGNGFILSGLLWAAFLSELITRRVKRASCYLVCLSLLSFFGFVHSAQSDGGIYIPWKLDGSIRQVPYQFAMGYMLLAGIVVVLSFRAETSANKRGEC